MMPIAREASAIVARVYATDFEVDFKGPADPVTQADREANALICARLAEVFGPLPVVAEESDESEFAGWVGAPRVFFVDPLDGTLEFVAKNGDFVVMIGLAEEGRAGAGGGTFTDAIGRPLGYGGPELTNNDGFLATNGKLHARVLEQLKRAAEGG